MKNWRINLILFFIILFGAAIIGRLYFLQILHKGYYKALAQGQQKLLAQIKGERGEIFFRNKTSNGFIPLAINIQQNLVYACPREIKNKQETAQSLSNALDLSSDFILGKLLQDNLYELIKNKLTEEEVETLKHLNLSGIYLGQEPARFYPQETMCSQVVGFLGAENNGQYGLEGYYDKILQGKEKLQEKSRNPWERLSLSLPEVQKGSDLILTLDYYIQFKAEKLLEQAKKNLDIEEGTIIVLNPISGEILALANFPNFDPNQYSTVKNLKVFQNNAIQKIFEPGSVFKPFTMAAALNEGKITPHTTYTDPGFIKIGGWPIYNYKQRKYPGEISMTEVLEKSINTGAVFAEQVLGSNLFSEYLEKFEFFKPTKIDLQGEVYSENKEFKKGYEINFVTASFGQGIEITPIQLTKAFSALINGGNLINPHIVKNSEKQSQNKVISHKTSSQLTAMLVSVVENGFGNRAKVPGYYIGGKTGTSQISWGALGIDKQGYSDKTWQTFIGFGPAFNPQFLILIKLKNPKTQTAEYSAAPVFHDLAKYIIDYWQIPPDYE